MDWLELPEATRQQLGVSAGRGARAATWMAVRVLLRPAAVAVDGIIRQVKPLQLPAANAPSPGSGSPAAATGEGGAPAASGATAIDMAGADADGASSSRSRSPSPGRTSASTLRPPSSSSPGPRRQSARSSMTTTTTSSNASSSSLRSRSRSRQQPQPRAPHFPAFNPQPPRPPAARAVLLVVYALLFVLVSPLTLLGGLLRLAAAPFLPRCRVLVPSKGFAAPSSLQLPGGPRQLPPGPLAVRLLTANLCCLPEFAARFNNLSCPGRRAHHIGQRIAALGRATGHTAPRPPNRGRLSTARPELVDVAGAGGLRLFAFPTPLDVVCLQEVFSAAAQNALIEALDKSFPFIVCDAQVNRLRGNRCFLSSGLFLASRYPVLAADFQRYSVAAGIDKLACKGVLMAKVDQGGVVHSSSRFSCPPLISPPSSTHVAGCWRLRMPRARLPASGRAGRRLCLQHPSAGL